MKISCLACCLLAQAAVIAVAQQPGSLGQTTDPEMLFEPREFADQQGEVLKYRLLKPLDYSAETKYPLVIFLHGAGERGDDNLAQLKHCMGEFCKPERRKRFPCYVLAPQCPAGQKWSNVDWSADSVTLPESISGSLGATLKVVEAMLEEAAIDKERIYVTGLSMGGFGTWDALARRPELFAAAIPICGGGDPQTAPRFAKVPIWCFHGGDDSVVKPQLSRDMVAALKQAGGEPRYTEYAGVGHDSWTATFSNDETFSWLFAQRGRQR